MEHPFYPSHPDELAEQDAFRAARRDGLYSTDSVAILQLSRYATPLSVYLDKVEPQAPAEPASLQAWLGWRLEDSLAQLYAERYGGDTPMRMPLTHVHPVHDFIRTHLDWAHGDVLVEGKTRTQRSPAWGPDGSSKVPPDVWVQCQHEMMVTGFVRCRVAVLFGLHTFHVYELAADPIFQGKLTDELVRFWHEHVLARVPPEPIALGPDISWSKRHPMTDESLAQATPEMEALLRRVRMARLAVSQAEDARDALDAQVRELIGERAGLMGLFGEVTYKPTSGRTDWKLLAGTYLKAIEALVPWVPTAEADPILAQVRSAPELYTKPGVRTLRYSWSEQEGDD